MTLAPENRVTYQQETKMPWFTSKKRNNNNLKVLHYCYYNAYRNGEALTDAEEGFEAGTEITFNCILGAGGVRTTWKITCEDGGWIGRSENCGKH